MVKQESAASNMNVNSQLLMFLTNIIKYALIEINY